MPRRRIVFDPGPLDGEKVRSEFIDAYGGSESNWDWLQRKLSGLHPDDVKDRCVRLIEEPRPCDFLKLPPCYVFGRLEIEHERAWWEGLEQGVFWIEAVVHDSFANAYFEARKRKAKEEDDE
jgi:hypothetical protein